MRKILLILLLFPLFGFSQDIIVKNDGTEIKAKVTEITPDLIKYKSFDNPDGPIYNIYIKDILKIKYQNGKEELFKKDTSQEPQEIRSLPQTQYYNKDIKTKKKGFKFDFGLGMGPFIPFNTNTADTYGSVFWQGDLNFTFWFKDLGPRIDLGMAFMNKAKSYSYYNSTSASNTIVIIPVSAFFMYKIDPKNNKKYPYFGIGLDSKYVTTYYDDGINNNSNQDDYKYYQVDDLGIMAGYRLKFGYIEAKVNPGIGSKIEKIYGLDGLCLTIGFRF